ncbi:MAG: OmpA family protein [Sedimentisphaerales bacterium]|nr:OmpA family protein [Sedimentisphaerales bacterium]
MQSARKTTVLILIAVVVMFLSGCTDWKKKYNALNVEYQNLKGLLERERAEKGQLAGQVAQGQQTIEELQRQIAERNQSPAVATGFGEGYDVAFDPTAGTVTVTLENRILFAAGKVDLRSTSELNHIAEVLKQKYGGMQIEVVGHTDSDPIKKSKWADNWELSSQRALAVLRYLVKKGISEDSIRASGRGASQPVASNTSSSGKSQNRRVEIVVYIR